ncbi:hypothetical protein WG904_19370 [Pedobacter sp. Du54]|uniref:hypothetical protein n=1 Tax=Pedobacter anseongensis TaxID=3133439 RepID=UPI0030A5B1AD
MQKFPFTSEGAAELFDQIFALPDPQLQVEAQAIASDFKSWVANHFYLSESQTEFLNQIDSNFIAIAAEETSNFVSMRKMVHLIKPLTGNVSNSNNGEGSDEGKLLDLDKKKKASYTADGEFTESEELAFTISYN